MNKEVLDGLFRPKSVAVIGASATPGKIGYSVVEALNNGKYEGKIYPINLKQDEILGHKAYPTISDVPGTIDLAVITIPAKLVLGAIEECGKKRRIKLSGGLLNNLRIRNQHFYELFLLINP